MVIVTRFVTCEHVGVERPHDLVGVRRPWRKPLEQFGVYIEFDRQDEEFEFAWSLRLWRGKSLVAETTEELELPGRRFTEAGLNLRLDGVEAKSYRIEVLIDGVAVASTVVDFGDKEAEA